MFPIISSCQLSPTRNKNNYLTFKEKAGLISDVTLFLILATVGTLAILATKGIPLNAFNAMGALGIKGGTAFAALAGTLFAIDVVTLVVLLRKRHRLNPVTLTPASHKPTPKEEPISPVLIETPSSNPQPPSKQPAPSIVTSEVTPSQSQEQPPTIDFPPSLIPAPPPPPSFEKKYKKEEKPQPPTNEVNLKIEKPPTKDKAPSLPTSVKLTLEKQIALGPFRSKLTTAVNDFLDYLESKENGIDKMLLQDAKEETSSLVSSLTDATKLYAPEDLLESMFEKVDNPDILETYFAELTLYIKATNDSEEMKKRIKESTEKVTSELLLVLESQTKVSTSSRRLKEEIETQNPTFSPTNEQKEPIKKNIQNVLSFTLYSENYSLLDLSFEKIEKKKVTKNRIENELGKEKFEKAKTNLANLQRLHLSLDCNHGPEESQLRVLDDYAQTVKDFLMTLELKLKNVVIIADLFQK